MIETALLRSIRSPLTWLMAFGLNLGCGSRTVPSGTDTSSHWLSSCDADTQCTAEQRCLCGVCTRSCDAAKDCRDLSEDAICSTGDDCSSVICTLSDRITPVEAGCTGSGCAASSTDPDGGNISPPANTGETSVSPPTNTSGTESSSSVTPDETTGPTLGPECAFLFDTTGAATCNTGSRKCAQFKVEERARLASIELAATGKNEQGEEVTFSTTELDARHACVIQWATEQGLAAERVDQELLGDTTTRVEVTGTWAELEPLLVSVGVLSYTLDCTDAYACAYCSALDEQGCNADAFCSPYTGDTFDAHDWCLNQNVFFECIGADHQCNDALTVAADDTGQCWLFYSGCETERPYYPGAETCDEYDVLNASFTEAYCTCDTPLPGVMPCECDKPDAEVCNGQSFSCYDGVWWAGEDGICMIHSGRCDRTFDTLEACLAADYDCTLGPNPESDRVCAIQLSALEYPAFSDEQCAAMGGVLADGKSGTEAWVRLTKENRWCTLPDASIPTAACQAVGGYAACSADEPISFCNDDETPVAPLSDCEIGEGYCCVPDAAQ